MTETAAETAAATPTPTKNPVPSPVSDPRDRLPPLVRDRSFGGILATQFLGAFNDNLFKQIVLLICLDQARRATLALGEPVGDLQWLAQGLFAIPFVLFSGLAGFYADRISKRRIVVWSKIAEIAVMALGGLAFFIGIRAPGALLPLLMGVLFLMGLQSTFFGPAKYGILPELFRDSDLPQANGFIQTTTFLAIIFGIALAGFVLDWFPGRLWIGGLCCVAVATLGTATAFLLRPTPVARPGLEFEWSTLIGTKSVWKMLAGDRPLLRALFVSTIFWFVGAVTLPVANALGLDFLGWSKSRTSLLAATIGLGICVGCLTAAAKSRHRVDFRITKVGTWGLVLTFIGLWGLSTWQGPVAALPPVGSAQNEPLLPLLNEPLLPLLAGGQPMEWAFRGAMFAVGFWAGMFIVPLQVFMQARPPAEFKGRMIGAMNQVNWIGVVLSAPFYQAAQAAIPDRRSFPLIFLALAACLLPVGLLFRPKNEALSHSAVR